MDIFEIIGATDLDFTATKQVPYRKIKARNCTTDAIEYIWLWNAENLPVKLSTCFIAFSRVNRKKDTNGYDFVSANCKLDYTLNESKSYVENNMPKDLDAVYK